MQTVEPTPGWVFCRLIQPEKKTKSGILLTEAQETTPIAEVVNVGLGVIKCKPLDRILYKNYSLFEIKLNEEKFVLVEEKDILGTILEVE